MIFKNLDAVAGEYTVAHDGEGKIFFREVLADELASDINFLHYTVMPAGTSIGYHRHVGTEEVYVVLEGSGVLTMNGKEYAVKKGDVMVANDGDSHGLLNNTEAELKILVFEGNVK